MGNDLIIPDEIDNNSIQDANFKDILGQRYLAYALSTIMHRALPDVRDGLKPVHRRLLYAMRMLKLNPNTPFKKSARVVGDVIGKYHPHGDQAVYDALVRLAQDFAVRYPLIDGQGNFGNVDGDNAAAMRYTEARLTAVAESLLDGLDDDTVDFRPNYDGSEEEPIVLPSAFPNLLANGSTGIAVGMATNIPPHNVEELCNGLLYLIQNPNVTVRELVEQFIQGPDFPTGGILIDDKENTIQTYETGKGSFRIRAKWEKEDLGRGSYQIIITEIPYQVQKSKLIEKIAALIDDKKLPLLGDVRDESTEDIRIILEPKNRTVDDMVLMEMLFKMTELETRFHLNMNVLNAKCVPGVMSLKEVLRAFLDHRREVLLRRSRYRLQKIDARIHILDGFLIAFLNIDEVIRIIREDDKPKDVLMQRFGLSEEQTEAILNLRLRALAKIEEFEINKEHKQLSAEKAEIEALLASDKKQWKTIASEINYTKNRFGSSMPHGARKTIFAEAPIIDIDTDAALIEKEPITVILSKQYWIRAMKGHIASDAEVKFKEGDEELYRLQAYTTDKIVLFTTGGKAYTIGADKLPSGRSLGEPVRLMADIGDQEICSIIVPKLDTKYLVASSQGKGFLINGEDMIASTKTGKAILTVEDKHKAILCKAMTGDHIALVGQNRKMLMIESAELPVMNKGKGVFLQRFKDGDLSDATSFNLNDGLIWKGNKTPFKDYTEYKAARASFGRLAPRGFPRDNRF